MRYHSDRANSSIQRGSLIDTTSLVSWSRLSRKGRTEARRSRRYTRFLIRAITSFGGNTLPLLLLVAMLVTACVTAQQGPQEAPKQPEETTKQSAGEVDAEKRSLIYYIDNDPSVIDSREAAADARTEIDNTAARAIRFFLSIPDWSLHLGSYPDKDEQLNMLRRYADAYEQNPDGFGAFVRDDYIDSTDGSYRSGVRYLGFWNVSRSRVASAYERAAEKFSSAADWRWGAQRRRRQGHPAEGYDEYIRNYEAEARQALSDARENETRARTELRAIAERQAEVERQREEVARKQAETDHKQEAARQAEVERQAEAERQRDEVARMRLKAEQQATTERQARAEQHAEAQRQAEAEWQARAEQQQRSGVGDECPPACAGADLRGKDLSGADFSGADLRRAKLFGAVLVGANLTNANLDGVDGRSADFTDAILLNAKLADGLFVGADLTGANLSGSNAVGAVFRDAILKNADLSGAIFTSANLWRVDAEDADFSSADLQGSILLDSNLIGADFARANLASADAVGANLAGASLRGADLTGANFGWVDLTDANLIAANLTDAIISWADIRGAKLTTADFTGTDFAASNLSNIDLRREDLSGVDFGFANLSGANLSVADLTDADLSPADLTGALLRRAQLMKADLFLTRLTDADLSEANLSFANLNGNGTLRDAKLDGTNLSYAGLRDANLVGAKLSSVNLTGADLAGANLTGADLPPPPASDVEGWWEYCQSFSPPCIVGAGKAEGERRGDAEAETTDDNRASHEPREGAVTEGEATAPLTLIGRYIIWTIEESESAGCAGPPGTVIRHSYIDENNIRVRLEPSVEPRADSEYVGFFDNMRGFDHTWGWSYERTEEARASLVFYWKPAIIFGESVDLAFETRHSGRFEYRGYRYAIEDGVPRAVCGAVADGSFTIGEI